ncbi:hypothetical protein BGW38_000585, partial [Lunasporangiospora selenospora]
MAAPGSASSGKNSDFMSEYMSGLHQSQDLNAFLQKNQPTYDPSQQNHPKSSSAAFPQNQTPGSESMPETSQSAKKESAPSGLDPRAPPGSHPMPSAHLAQQRQAIEHAAMDNCADLNAELTDCLLGRSGTWWDRASMCMKAKERFAKCCRLNREFLQQAGFAKEGNTVAEDRAIQDQADRVMQEAMKKDK